MNIHLFLHFGAHLFQIQFQVVRSYLYIFLKLNYSGFYSVLISAVQQRIQLHTYIHSLLYSFPLCFVPGIECSCQCYTVGPCCLSILYATVCVCQPLTPTPSLPPIPLATTSLASLSVILFLFCSQVHLCYIVDSTRK